jgi:hypothetical protein
VEEAAQGHQRKAEQVPKVQRLHHPARLEPQPDFLPIGPIPTAHLIRYDCENRKQSTVRMGAQMENQEHAAVVQGINIPVGGTGGVIWVRATALDVPYRLPRKNLLLIRLRPGSAITSLHGSREDAGPLQKVDRGFDLEVMAGRTVCRPAMLGLLWIVERHPIEVLLRLHLFARL